MILGTKKTLFDHIIEALLEKPRSVAEILTYLKVRHVSVTVQGIYKTLRELIAEDIAVKQKKNYLVNNVWREKAAGLFTPKTRFTLAPGESVNYKFKKIEHLDQFWKHTLADIEYEVGLFPVFHFTPHQFWSYVPGRRESEREYYTNLDEEKINVYTIIGGDSSVDKIARDDLKNDIHQVALDPKSSFNRRDHVSVIGSYIIITRVAIVLAKQVDHAYRITSDEKVLEKSLEQIFKNPGSISMIVEFNETRAKKLRKQMSRDFHIPRELHETFDLF